MKQLLLLVTCLLATTIAAAEPPVTIGVSTPLTGPNSSIGEDIRRSLLFANEELAGGRYQFIFEDDTCSGRGAAMVAQKFVNVDKVRYVLGHGCSSAVLGSASIYEKAKVVVITPSASSATISQAGEYIFRTWPSDSLASRRLFDYVESKHRNLGVMSEVSDYAQGFLANLEAANTRNEVAIINENFASDSADYRPLLTRLRANNIDSLFINSQTESSFLAVLRQVKDLKIDVPIYGAYWPGSKVFLDQAGSLAEGIVYVDVPSANDTLNVEGRALLQKFKAKHGELKYGEMLFSTTFESLRALHQALESGKDVREFLLSSKFQGTFGTWNFDTNGDIEGLNFKMNVVRGGVGVTLE